VSVFSLKFLYLVEQLQAQGKYEGREKNRRIQGEFQPEALLTTPVPAFYLRYNPWLWPFHHFLPSNS
jgi:hypothetical protein